MITATTPPVENDARRRAARKSVKGASLQLEMQVQKGVIAKMKQGKLDKNFDISIHPEGGGTGVPQKFSLHWHEYYEAEILLTGHATEYVNEKIIEKDKGAFSILTPSACHSVELDENALLVNIRMRKRFFDSFEELRKKIELPGGHISGTLSPKDFRDVISVCQIVRDDFEKTNLLSEPNKSLVFYILQKLVENMTVSSQSKPAEKRISDILFYLNHNFTQKITVESTAKEFGFEKNYFGKKFYSQVGMSLNNYVNSTRLNYGYSLVVDNELTIEEIAHACGFENRTYFTTLFRQKFGVSPGKCREQSRVRTTDQPVDHTSP